MKIKRICFLLALLLVIPAVLSCGTKYDTVYTYNGHTVNEDKYYYWLSSYKRNILNSYTDAYDTEEFWSQEFSEGVTVEQYFTDTINNRIMDYVICDSLFREYKLSIDDDTKDEIDADIDEKIEYYGGKKELNSELENLKLTVSTLKECYETEEKLTAVYNYLFGEGGDYEPTDDEIIEYYNTNYSHIKYIVFYTEKILTDSDGNYQYDDSGNIMSEALSEDELNKKNALVDECLEYLTSGGDFDTAREKYSEYDTSAYTNGFFISENEVGTWGSDIILASKDAEINQIIKVTEDSAIYIIQKLELTDLGDMSDTDVEQVSSISTYVAQEKYEKYFAEKRKEVEINQEILDKYKLSSIKANPYYSF